jgi:FkbM family methyltransferase
LDHVFYLISFMPSFHNHLVRQIAAGLQSYQENNTDYLRFPTSGRQRLIDRLLRCAARFDWFRHTPSHRAVVDLHLADIEPHLEGLAWLYGRLADDQSRQTLIEVLAYRLLGSRHIRINSVHEAFWRAVPIVCDKAVVKHRTHTIGTLDGWLDDFDLSAHGYQVRLSAHRLNIMHTFLLEQYRFLSPTAKVGVKPGDVVIDGGGCWGDTALYFADQVGPQGKVHVFEFSPANLALLHHNTAHNPELKERIHLHEAALWSNSTDTLCFDEAGPGTRIGAGSCHAQTCAIDDWVVTENISHIHFIKMDIEGAEGKALNGARSTIQSQHPTLAIALYHALDDFIHLPQLIDEIAPGYHFHLGHYTIHQEETILFATR